MREIEEGVLRLLSEGEFWAAITGALVGGLISLLGQHYAVKEARNERLENRQDMLKATAQSLLAKLTRLHSNFVFMQNEIERAYKDNDQIGTNSTPETGVWRRLQTFSNVPSDLSFSDLELALLFELDDPELAGSFMMMDEKHNSFMASVRTYSQMRNQFTTELPTEMHSNGTFFSIGSEKDLKLARPKMYQLNSLAADLKKWATEDAKSTGLLLERLSKELKNQFKLKYRVIPKIRDDKESK